MLGKVFKYELKASSRFLLPAIGLALGIGLMLLLATGLSNLLVAHFKSDIAAAFGYFLSVASYVLNLFMLVGIGLAVLGVLAIRFYQAFSGPEAYTTFSLPVKVSTLLCGHSLSALVYCAFSGVSMLFLFLSFFIANPVFSTPSNITITLGTQASSIPFSLWDFSPGFLILLTIGGLFLLIASFFFGLFQVYLAIAIGGQFGQNRILASVVSYFAINLVESIASLLLTGIPIAIYLTLGGGLKRIVHQINTLGEAAQLQLGFQWCFWFSGIFMLIYFLFTVVHFLVCRWLYTKRLNLA